jgi:hypothetical protein
MRGQAIVTLVAILGLLVASGLAEAAEPPELLSYQGVLRDAEDDALEGAHDMIFELYDDAGGELCVGGTLLLSDAHEASGTGAVEVSGGLFTAHVGSGAVTPGAESSLAEVFRNNEVVYLQVTVEGEALCPRIRVVSSGYALNADNLDGRDGSGYVDTSADPQAKTGDLAVGALTVNGDDLAFGGGAQLLDEGMRLRIHAGDDDTDALLLAAGDGSGDGYIQLYGGGAILLRSGNGMFEFVNGAVGGTRAQLEGDGDLWISGDLDVRGNDIEFGYGSTLASGIASLELRAGDLDGDDLVLSAGNSTDDGAIEIYGDQLMRLRSGDGHFEFFRGYTSLIADLSPAGDLQIDGNFDAGGVLTGDGSGLTDVTADTLDSLDSTQFLRSDGSDSFTAGTLSFAAGTRLGVDSGVETAPGLHVAADADTGLFSPGSNQLALTTGGSQAFHVYGNGDGVLAGRLYVGGSTAESLSWDDADSRFEFSDDVHTGERSYADSFVDAGNTDFSVDPSGISVLHGLRLNSTALYLNYDGPDATSTIYFHEAGSPSGAYLRWHAAGGEFQLSHQLVATGGDYGVEARGTTAGGYFADADNSGYGYVGYSEYGGNFIGDGRGVRGYDSDDSTYGYLAYGSSSTYGNGAKNFVQNHPDNEDQVIVYAAPEGNEVATYTRGTARLAGGEARIALDETFAWVTNPDIGLTAHLTPRGREASLYVDSLSTSELVVRAAPGSAGDVVFDYMVWGLRIGFEEAGVVREKGEEEARIPSMAAHRAMREKHPEWDRHLALERFREMRLQIGETAPLDLTASLALRDAIEEYDPAVHGRTDPLAPRPGATRTESAPGAGPDAGRVSEGPAPGPAGGGPGTPPLDEHGHIYATSFRPSASDMASLAPVTGPVEAGDVLVIDGATPGVMAVSHRAADAAVFGVVAKNPGVVLGSRPPQAAGVPGGVSGDDEGGGGPEVGGEPVEVPVAWSGVAVCKVDAGYGSIRPGDLLMTSPTRGHAMRADDPRPGTVLGKALEPLDTGTGRIRILVTLR